MIEHIGLIAGGGQFPMMVAQAAKKQGHYVVAVAHDEETEPSLSEHVDEIVWIKLGQLGKLIEAFKKRGVKKALMAGSITKKRIFGNIMPDIKALSLASKLAIFHDDSILGATAKELKKEGVEIVSSTYYLPELFTSPACLTRKRPSRAEKEDIDFGWQVAKEIGRLDIGQCVVLRKKTILAIEALEGTDETILRGGRLAGKKAVVVKVSKPQQDLRFDVPTVGLETVKVMSQVKASVLAVEAGKTLMFDKPELIAYADKIGICIISR
ncbi:MAG: LpxI family protein [Desulfobacterales bacterium]|nr:LpxI family protein [Desulfobacterales bacterium]